MWVALLIATALPSVAAAQPIGPDLSATARTDRATADVGEDVGLIVAAANGGPTPATDTVLTVVLADGLILQAVEEAPGPCTEGRRIECRLGALAPGSSAQVRVLLGATTPGSLVVTATVDAREDDPNPSNDQAAGQVAARGSPCDLVGSLGPDDLRANRRGEALCGFGGDDTIIGGPRGDVLLGGSGGDALIGDAGRDRVDGGDGVDACAADPGPGTRRGCERTIFALADRLPLVDLGPTTVGYGYHQSLFGTAIGLRPFGAHVVMGSRGRGTGSTTSTDVVVGSRARVRAPVTGEVVGVKRYLLYCERPDWKVVIKPVSDPSLRVLVLHLGRPGIEDGDEVVAGVSRIGRASVNDWPDSQANRYFPDQYPHIHVEVERNRASPTPGCSL